jgi:hypothetical protein
VAYRTGKKLEWDYVNLRARNAPEADKWPRLPSLTLRLTPARRLVYPSDRGVFIMTHLQEEVIAKFLHLAPEDVEKVLHFIETLAPAPAAPLGRSLRGRFAHLGVHISADDIGEARKEAWANFPRDISRD